MGSYSGRHAKWVAYLQKFTFSLKHKSKVQNKDADALSRKVNLSATLRVHVARLDLFHEMYGGDLDFGQIWLDVQQWQPREYHFQDGFLFRGV